MDPPAGRTGHRRPRRVADCRPPSAESKTTRAVIGRGGDRRLHASSAVDRPFEARPFLELPDCNGPDTTPSQGEAILGVERAMNADPPESRRGAGPRVRLPRAADTAFAVPIEFRAGRLQDRPCRSLGHELIRLRERHTLKARVTRPLRFVTES